MNNKIIKIFLLIFTIVFLSTSLSACTEKEMDRNIILSMELIFFGLGSIAICFMASAFTIVDMGDFYLKNRYSKIILILGCIVCSIITTACFKPIYMFLFKKLSELDEIFNIFDFLYKSHNWFLEINPSNCGWIIGILVSIFWIILVKIIIFFDEGSVEEEIKNKVDVTEPIFENEKIEYVQENPFKQEISYRYTVSSHEESSSDLEIDNPIPKFILFTFLPSMIAPYTTTLTKILKLPIDFIKYHYKGEL